MSIPAQKYIPIFCVFLILTVSACGTPQTPSIAPTSTIVVRTPTITPFPVVTVPGSEVRTLTSSNTGRDYDIYVLLPEGYDKNASREYPVLYVLDGQWDFKLLASIYGGLLYDNAVTEMIIVGITYSGPNPDYDALRAMDYTTMPTSSIPGSGDAPKFHAFLKDELMPFVESSYHANPSRRILMGSSYGGLFTLYALYTEPELFWGYISASPAVTYGDQDILQREKDYFSTHKDLPARLFIAVGNSETLYIPVQMFAKAIDERGYTDLILKSMVIEGEGHAGNKPEAFNRGLRFIFQGK